MEANQLIEEIANQGVGRVAAAMVVAQLTQDPREAKQPGELNLILKGIGNANSVVWRDEDVDALKVSTDLCVSFIAASSVGAFAPGAIASLVVLLFRLHKKGFEVTPVQGRILDSLRNGLALAPVDISLELEISETIVIKELGLLAKAKRRDGYIDALVKADDEGKWSAHGI